MNVLLAGYSVHEKPLELVRYKLLWYLIRLQRRGFSEAIVNGQSYLLGPSDLLICKPGVFYKMRVANDLAPNALPSADYFIQIRPDDSWVTEWSREFAQACRMNIVLDEKLLALWDLIIFEQNKKNADEELINYLCRALLLTISNLNRSADKNHRELAVSIKIKDFIEKNSSVSLSLRTIAAHVNLSIPHVSEIFKASFGQSIMDYVIEVRVSTAKKLILISDLKLSEISLICGFPTYIHFNRTFKSRTGLSPSQYKIFAKANPHAPILE